MVLYNLTVTSQAANVRYYPARDSSAAAPGWTLAYDNGPSRSANSTGAQVDIDWFGTAVYLYGSASSGAYALSMDSGPPMEEVPSMNGDLLGKFEGLEYGNHTVSMQVLGNDSTVSFSFAVLTLQLGDEGARFSMRNETAVVQNPNISGRLERNSFFTYSPAGSWGISSQPDNVQDVPTRRTISSTTGDTARFTLTNAYAFIIWGATDRFRHGVQVTVTPPEDEGPARTRLVNTSSPANRFETHEMNYYETGLNRDKEYQVEIMNPDVGMPNIADLRYIDILDAQPSIPTDEPQPTSASQLSLSPGAIGGIVVGIVAFLAMVSAIAFFIVRSRRNLRNREELNTSVVGHFYPDYRNEPRNGSEGFETLVVERDADAGPVLLPPTYDDIRQLGDGRADGRYTPSTSEDNGRWAGGTVSRKRRT